MIPPRLLVCNWFHDVPVLRNLAVPDSPEIIVGCGTAAESALGNSQHIVALCKNLMDVGVDHLDTLFAKCLKSRAKAGQTIGNTGVVLDVGVAVKIEWSLLWRLALQYVVQEVLDKLAVRLRFVEVFQRITAVGLRVILPSASKRKISKATCSPAPAKL